MSKVNQYAIDTANREETLRTQRARLQQVIERDVTLGRQATLLLMLELLFQQYENHGYLKGIDLMADGIKGALTQKGELK